MRPALWANSVFSRDAQSKWAFYEPTLSYSKPVQMFNVCRIVRRPASLFRDVRYIAAVFWSSRAAFFLLVNTIRFTVYILSYLK